jgi:DNA-binding transcriptional regulator PaaX
MDLVSANKKRARKFLESETVAATATKVILSVVAFGAIVGGAAAFPGLLAVVRQYRKFRKFSDKEIRYAYYGTKKRGLIKSQLENENDVLVLSEKGNKRILDFDLDTLSIKQPWRWDKKWRVVLYDIPVRFNPAREGLRETLKDLGLIQFQKSAWLYPYDCLGEVIFVADYYGVGKYIDYIEADRMTKWKKFERAFDIS